MKISQGTSRIKNIFTRTAPGDASTQEPKLEPQIYPELVFGLVGAVGTDFESTTTIIENKLTEFGYTSKTVRVSEIIRDVSSSFISFSDSPYVDVRFNDLMGAGTEIREKCKDGRVLALLSSLKIRYLRKEDTGRSEVFSGRVAYIIRSLKHPDEISALRKIYGPAFFVIGIYTSRENRKKILSDQISRSRKGAEECDYNAEAEKLIGRDEEEKNVRGKLGQRLQDTFSLSDVFTNGKDRKNIKSQISRFLDMLFGHPFITPTIEEISMNLAHGAALASSDLSRQVGAVLIDSYGDIISTGCNEVPKSGGGYYRSEDEFDRRDHVLGEDNSHTTKLDVFREVLNKLNKAGWLSPEKSKRSIEDLITEALDADAGDAPLEGAKLMDLLEFGRVVHAEMHALAEAGRKGISTRESTLYCTTFPCHNCARQLIAAGVKKVVYIEPYPKSDTDRLYEDSVSVGDDTIEGKVQFVAFNGVSPNRFGDLFSMMKRKDKLSGKTVNWNPATARPRPEIYPTQVLTMETIAAAQLGNELLPRLE